MALAIKITPVLEGKASERFNKLINEQKKKKISAKKKKQMDELLKKVLSNKK